jgi:hypothetical protein
MAISTPRVVQPSFMNIWEMTLPALHPQSNTRVALFASAWPWAWSHVSAPIPRSAVQHAGLPIYEWKTHRSESQCLQSVGVESPQRVRRPCHCMRQLSRPRGRALAARGVGPGHRPRGAGVSKMRHPESRSSSSSRRRSSSRSRRCRRWCRWRRSRCFSRGAGAVLVLEFEAEAV